MNLQIEGPTTRFRAIDGNLSLSQRVSFLRMRGDPLPYRTRAGDDRNKLGILVASRGSTYPQVTSTNWRKMSYFFGGEAFEAKDIPESQRRIILGDKGAGLVEMAQLGLPVPPGFTLPTYLCSKVMDGTELPTDLKTVVAENILRLEKASSKVFGDPENPLIVSVRSGGEILAPGMMDTVLNIGLTKDTLEGLAEKSNDRRFALDSYRRLIEGFGNVNNKKRSFQFEDIINGLKAREHRIFDSHLTEENLEEIIAGYERLYRDKTNEDFPQDPHVQLEKTILAAFRSWNTERALTYREHEGIPNDDYRDEEGNFHFGGTAVTIQQMVFGNMGEDSGTGVCFSRNPLTGKKELYGEFLPNAQGEELVLGIRTPFPVAKLEIKESKVFEQLVDGIKILEKIHRDMRDIEFTYENGKLYFLQSRTGKRTGFAAVKIANDLVADGIIDNKQAIMTVSPYHISQILTPVFDPKELAKASPIAKGLAASPEAGVGKAIFNAQELIEFKEHNPDEDYMLVRTETSPDDLPGMIKASAFLTAKGGNTSHAAVLARGMGKPAVVGCEVIEIDEINGKAAVFDHIGGKLIHTVHKGDFLSLNGSTGFVYLGKIKTKIPELSKDLKEFISRVNEFLLNYDADSISSALASHGFDHNKTFDLDHNMRFDPESITHLMTSGLTDINAQPFHLPIGRLQAAQAVIRSGI